MALVPTAELQNMQNMIDNHKAMTERVAVLEEENEALRETVVTHKADMKDLEQFRPLLQAVPLQFYKIQLRDSPTMKALLGRMSKAYGPRFDKELKDVYDLDADDSKDQTKFVRQCLDSAALACIRYCVTQNSRWNDMMEHFLS